MAYCPGCEEEVRPVLDPSATPKGTGEGIAAATWICQECSIILGVSEIDLLSSSTQNRTNIENRR